MSEKLEQQGQNKDVSRKELLDVLAVITLALKKVTKESADNLEYVTNSLDKNKNELLDVIKSVELTPGEKGDKGDTGEKGEQGDKGEDGKNGLNGKDGKDGKNGKDGKDADESIIVSKAVKQTTEIIKPLIPTIESIGLEIPKFGESIRDALELLQGDERLDKSAIKGLPELIDLMNKEIRVVGGNKFVIHDSSLTGDGTLSELAVVPSVIKGYFSATTPIVYDSATGVISFDSATTSLTKYVLKTGDTMTGNLNLGVNTLIAHSLRSDSTDGVLIESATGTDVGIFGAGNTANSLFYGGVNVNGAINGFSTSTFAPTSDIAPVVIQAFGTSTSIKSLDIKDSAGNSWAYIRKRLLSDANFGAVFDFTTSGSTATARGGLVVNLAAGYTGSEYTGALAFDNAVAGTATYYLADATTYGYRPGGNRGFGGFARGVTTGHNIGGMMLAGGGAINYAAWCSSTVTKSGGFNVGVFANAHNASAGANTAFIGLYATCFNTNLTAPPNMSGIQTALLADNQSYTCPIAIFRSNGTSFVSIEDAGQLLLGNRLSTTSLGRLFNIPADVATTDATLTVAESYTTATDTMYTMKATLTIQSSDRTKGGTIEMMGTFKNVAGTVTQIGITVVLNNTVTDAGITGAFTISGTAVRVSVTGLAATNIRFQNTFVINRVKY